MSKQVNIRKATFAGGCFWCMVHPFQQMNGVISVVSGYTGGETENPTYDDVCRGDTGHYEAVQITYDETLISYQELLEIFWTQIDPTDEGGQFVDRGSQYLTAIFCEGEDQRQQALSSRRKLELSGVFEKPITTQILTLQKFYEAEDYHQDYYKKIPPVTSFIEWLPAGISS